MVERVARLGCCLIALLVLANLALPTPSSFAYVDLGAPANRFAFFVVAPARDSTASVALRAPTRRADGIDIVESDCPMCGAPARPLIEDLNDVEDRTPGRYSIGECVRCGLIYLSTRPTADSLPWSYPTSYHVHDPVRRRPIPRLLYGMRLRARAARLANAIGPARRAILEVGCGDGSFLRKLSRRMPPAASLTGIDLMAPAMARRG